MLNKLSPHDSLPTWVPSVRASSSRMAFMSRWITATCRLVTFLRASYLRIQHKNIKNKPTQSKCTHVYSNRYTQAHTHLATASAARCELSEAAILAYDMALFSSASGSAEFNGEHLWESKTTAELCTRFHINAKAHTNCAHTHAYTHTSAPTPTCTLSRTPTCTCTHIQAQTHRRTRTHLCKQLPCCTLSAVFFYCA